MELIEMLINKLGNLFFGEDIVKVFVCFLTIALFCAMLLQITKCRVSDEQVRRGSLGWILVFSICSLLLGVAVIFLSYNPNSV